MGKREQVILQISEILKKDNRGLTIQELAKLTKVTRVTVSMALLTLEGMGKLDVRVLGNCKLHYWREGK